jgi:WD40 repeat protein
MIRYACPTFSPDSVALATGGFDGTVRFYSAANGALKKALVPGGLR